ncbi:TolC family protein [bacterium]|nr:MAG: TolC family protein [bacterium]
MFLRYVEATADEAMLTAARNQSEISSRLLQATEGRANDGAVPGVQVQRARIEADRSKRAVARREADVRASRLRLAAAMGIDGLSSPLRAVPDLSAILPTQSTAETPEIAVRTAEVQGATADVRTARLLGRPEFQIEARRAPFYETSNQIYARLQISFPLFDGRRTRAERGAAEDRRVAAERTLADTRQQAEAALQAARIEFVAAQEEVASFEPTLESARTLVLRSEVGLIEGATTFTDTLEAVRALREVEEGLVEARRRLGETLAELLRATGIVLPALRGAR